MTNDSAVLETQPATINEERKEQTRDRRTRVSDYFRLGKRQPSLDFVDVDVHGDVKVFVDPRALRSQQTEWSEECVSLIQNFFETVLNAIREGDEMRAKRILAMLHEPNETHLGLSIDEARGRGMAHELANNVYAALSQSEAVKTGMLNDLEDTILMVPGIAADIVSDISTNIIRGPLIAYTQQMCEEYGIPMEQEVVSGPLWDAHARTWVEGTQVPLPVVDDKKLVLVPKSIVRRRMDYDEDEYYRHYILTHLQEVEYAKPNSDLVHLLKNGNSRVTKKDVAARYCKGKGIKRIIVEKTLQTPQLLEKYRNDKRREFMPPLSHEDLAELLGTEMPDWDGLLRKLRAVETGKEQAHDYHMAAKDLLSALLYPHLDHPRVEAEINEGTKRIDIVFSNIARSGFF